MGVPPLADFGLTGWFSAADLGDKPHLARIETRAGHGSGKPSYKIIEEAAEVWAFAAEWTGLKVKAGGLGFTRRTPPCGHR